VTNESLLSSKIPFLYYCDVTSLCKYLMTNLFLTEQVGRTGKYWSEVVAVRTKRSEVRTKTTKGQYSPVRLELARLVSHLLYGTRVMLVCFLLKRTSGHLNSKGFRRNVFLMTRATQKEHATASLKTNLLN